MRVARIEIAWDVWLAGMHGHPLNKVESTLPADARVLSVENDGSRRVSYLTVESATFADVPELNFIPNFNPTYTVSITEMSMLADILSSRHDLCPHCGEPMRRE